MTRAEAYTFIDDPGRSTFIDETRIKEIKKFGAEVACVIISQQEELKTRKKK